MLWFKPPKEEGISCVIRARDEAEWIRLSILSIADFADEIVFVDNGSTDGTLELVRALKEERGLDQLRIFTYPPIDGVKVRVHEFYNFAFGQATKSWCMKWDGDFIARTGQRYGIEELKKLWFDHRNKIDLYRLGGPNLFGDHRHFYHQPPDTQEFCFERYLFRNRKWHHRMTPLYENLVLKAHKRKMYIGPSAEPGDQRYYFFHLMGLKPDVRIAFRATLSLWWKFCAENPGHGQTYEQWLADYWQTGDREEQAARCMELFFREGRIVPFEKIGGEWGEYPTIMKPYLERPRFEVVYENGKPFRRAVHADRPIPLPPPGPR